jgi:hypothetical protein
MAIAEAGRSIDDVLSLDILDFLGMTGGLLALLEAAASGLLLELVVVVVVFLVNVSTDELRLSEVVFSSRFCSLRSNRTEFFLDALCDLVGGVGGQVKFDVAVLFLRRSRPRLLLLFS